MRCPICNCYNETGEVCLNCGKNLISTNQNTQTNTKQKNKRIISLVAIGIVIILLIILYFANNYGLKKEVTIEIGTKNIKLEDFYKKERVKNKTSFVTDISNIDLNKVGKYIIEIKEKKKIKKTKLNLVDTTPPEVEFQDLEKGLSYKLNAEDFIVKMKDLSDMSVYLEKTNTQLSDYKDYYFTVVVSDKYNNKTQKKCRLRISLFKSEIVLELGQKLTKKDILFNLEKDKDYINQSEIDKINTSGIGEYEIKVNINDIDFVCKIKIQDTTPPKLNLRNISIYDDEKINGKDSFIISVSDASGSVNTNLKSNIDYSFIGEQKIIIEAVDKNNNKIEKEAVLTIKKDTEAPVFSGLNTLNVNKNTNIDYKKGVSANDKKDGKVAFSVNTNSVNISNYGTYYATYTASDKAGNKVTKKRKIVVNHDASDLNNLINEHANKAGSNYESIRKYVSSRIKYVGTDWGGTDPVWHGLTEFKGNCFVYANTYKSILEKKGYEVKLIWTTDKSHYWNLVKINGVWRHSDATPGKKHSMISAETDDVRLEHLQGRNWDHSAWPEAK